MAADPNELLDDAMLERLGVLTGAIVAAAWHLTMTDEEFFRAGTRISDDTERWVVDAVNHINGNRRPAGFASRAELKLFLAQACRKILGIIGEQP